MLSFLKSPRYGWRHPVALRCKCLQGLSEHLATSAQTGHRRKPYVVAFQVNVQVGTWVELEVHVKSLLLFSCWHCIILLDKYLILSRTNVWMCVLGTCMYLGSSAVKRLIPVDFYVPKTCVVEAPQVLRMESLYQGH